MSVQAVGSINTTVSKFTTPVIAAASQSQSQSIESSVMRVTVDDTFPRVLQYEWLANNAVMYGQEDALNEVKINGTSYTPSVTFSKTGSKASYTLSIPSIEVTISIDLDVVGNVLNYHVTGITESGTTKVSTFEIPNHNLLSVRSTQTGAAFSGTRLHTAVAGSGDTFLNVTGTPAIDSSPGNYMYSILNTNQLAGAVWTNAVQDYSADWDNDRLHKQTVNKTDYYRTGVWSAPWVYRPEGMSTTEPLPNEKVVITPDANGDGGVDWQDGAVAYRSISKSPFGSEKVPDLVVQRIPFNFASQATNPFLKTLDETKRIYLGTDGLQQFIELKGYQQEGHDSAHADYGNNIGIRQGGDADINTLVNEGHKYGGYFGVHISATGASPQAKYFSENLVDPNKPGWDWLDLSFDYNKAQMRSEAATGARLNRLKELKDRVPNLDFIYNDAWFENGFDGRRLAQEQNGLGWATTTEFPMYMEDDAIWYHWSVDYNYGGQETKGFNSQIARFIHNHHKDTWIARNPLLGGTELEAYEGWQGKVNYDDMIKLTFTTNLPTKYMQHFPILKWTNNFIEFTDHVSVSNATGTRVIKKDGITVLNGGSYLLPWSPKTEDKLYHWNANGGSTTWTLPVSWSGLQTVKLYKLTDQGKQFIQDLTVNGNQVAINALANTPYVVYKGTGPVTPDVKFGEGTPLKDPGFNSGNLSSWTVTGDKQAASVQRNTRGQYELKIASGDSVSVSGQLTGLSPGTYSAYVYVQVDGTRRARIGVKDYGGIEVSNYTDSSFAINSIGGDSKNGTKMQRMRVMFDVPAGQTTATLYLQGEPGTAAITFDDVHLMKVQRSANPTGAYFAEDFEHIDAGWYPFVKADAGGTTSDPRTSLANLHAPYTQKGWNGNPIDHVISGDWSLMSHKENTGLLYRTLPQTLRFAPGTNYTISFKYQNQQAGDYALVIGDGTREISSVNFDTVTSTKTFTKVIAGSTSGNTWVGIRKLTNNSSDFVMDDFTVQVGGEIPPPSVPQVQMTATATSQETAGANNPASNVLDGQSGTIWHTKWDLSNSLPQSITLNLGGTYNVTNLKYLPRQAGGVNGIITAYNVYVSDDGTNFTKVADGIWANDATEKNAALAPTSASYVKLEATAGNGGYASAAEINVNYEEPVIIPQEQMTATATGEETENENNSASNVVDGTSSTIWHTKWDSSNSLPQSITLDLGGSYQVSQLDYLPRQDGQSNGFIKSYNIYTSTDGVNFTKAATGNWDQSAAQKSVTFKPVTATHVKLEAVQGVNNYASAAEINVFSIPVATVPVTGVQLDKPQVMLKEGQTVELVATVLPENAKNKNVTWASSNDTVAKVEVKDGKTVVTALKAGSADITVTTVNGNFTAVSRITVQKGEVTPIDALTTLSAAGTVQTGEEFPVQLGLGSVTQSVYAQDIKMDYDSNVFDFVSARAAKEGILLVDTVKDTLGKLRFILANVGKELTGDSGILELKFKAKALTQPATGTIAVTDATLSDAQGVETKAQASAVGVSIATPPPGIPGDVNHDNKTTIGDLGIVAANYGKTSSSPDWEQVKRADINGDGKIDIVDLAFVASKIME
ncbi:endo-alpha-N-acetylgalactosaminidase family protein [Paenibacillus sp. MAHUQ-63]|nr:endo-alpha-N-acetylgalactosaminidase family protein [Paenibacillus sp. MAHUQ-63]MDD9265488.1 endo-alpha-N-acetylgalactosaminidase family protein [Paenibacillus sp. MAHUQ-63]